MNRYLPSDRSLTRWDSMCSQGTGSRCSCSCPPSCQPVCPGPGPSPCPPICPGPGPAPCPPICPGPGPAPCRLSAPGPSRPSGPAPLAPPARRVSLDLTVPLALPALRVFPGPHLSSKQKPLPPIRQINGRLMIDIITSLPFMISNCRDRVLRYFNKGLI